MHIPGITTPVGIVPDRVIGIRPRRNPGDVRWFFLEADRATMPVERRSPKQTSFAHKLRAYFLTWRQRVVAEFFPRFRVLTVTTTRERVRHLTDAHHRVNQGQGGGLFLFTDRAAFLESDALLHTPLVNRRGEATTLV